MKRGGKTLRKVVKRKTRKLDNKRKIIKGGMFPWISRGIFNHMMLEKQVEEGEANELKRVCPSSD